MRKFLSAVALLLGAMTAVASAQSPPPEPSVIVTQGAATLKRAPDRAWVSIAVEARQGKAADARREAATQMSALQTAVKAVGIAADAIKTTNFSLQPQMEWDGTRNQIRGYLVHNQIDVRVDNIDKVSDVIDAAGSQKTSGVLSVTISGVRFDLKNSEAIEQEALALAVKEALARAQAIAAALTRPLGPVIRVEDQRQPQQPPRIPFPMAARAVAGDAAIANTPIEPNEIEIRSTVSLTMGIR